MILAELAYIFMGSVVEKKYLSTTPSRFLYLTPANFITDKIISESEGSLYFSEKEYKRQSSNLVKIEYGDYLIYKRENNYQIIRFSQNIDKFIIPNQEFVVLRLKNEDGTFDKPDFEKNDLDVLISSINTVFKNADIDINQLKNIDIPVEISFYEDNNIEAENGVIDKYIEIGKMDIVERHFALWGIIRRIHREEILIMEDLFHKRRGWTNGQKSRFIESLLVNIPLPPFYFEVDINDKWLLVEGIERFNAIREFFVDKTLILTDLYFFADKFTGKNIDQLPLSYQRKAYEYSLLLYFIQPSTPQNIKKYLFNMINTIGK